ncbi:MFS transporter [Paenibacillus soyae]|uniref:MFS transporter n=1 Tax=Paenibacillus soyae TaxID=2969249 RepID=A0A9X2S9W0_9BACL|nr:MFS transporter [Paenibacillus soyae]MCR2805879.1 MFS transporter [Paenibacillus soyae]
MQNYHKQSYWSGAYLRICVCNLFLFCAFQMLLPILPVYMIDNGGSESAVGWITGLITIAAVLIRPFTGYALDRFRRNRIVFAGSTALALAAAAYTVSASTGWMAGVSLMLGIGWGMMTAAYSTIVSDLVPVNRQGTGIGTFMLFGMGGMAVAPFIGGWLIDEYGAPVLFGTACFLALLSLFLFLPGGISKPASGTSLSASEQYRALNVLFERTSLFPALLILLYTISYGGILSFASLFGVELGIENGGIFFLLSNAAAMLVRPAAGKMFDSRGHAAVLLPGLTIGIVALIVLSLSSGGTMFIIAACLYGLSFGAVQPSILALTIQRAAPDRRGAANSTFLVGMDSGIALGSISFGVIAQVSGYGFVFLCSAVTLIALLAVYIISLAGPKVSWMPGTKKKEHQGANISEE